MALSKESIQEFKDIFSKKYGKELTWAEAEESADNLVGFFSLLYKIDRRTERWKEKLKDHPKGFQLEDGKTYSCSVCGQQIENERTWFDQYGLKCKICQKAVDEGIIPGAVCENKDSWYQMWEMDYYFKAKSPTVRKFIRSGALKARVILSKTGNPYCYVFLIAENEGFLPPKPKGMVINNEDGSHSIEYGNIKSPFESNHGE